MALRFMNVQMFAGRMEDSIGQEELSRRRLSPALKQRLRKKILLETAADILLPASIQVGYHVCQLVTLRDL